MRVREDVRKQTSKMMSTNRVGRKISRSIRDRRRVMLG